MDKEEEEKAKNAQSFNFNLKVGYFDWICSPSSPTSVQPLSPVTGKFIFSTKIKTRKLYCFC